MLYHDAFSSAWSRIKFIYKLYVDFSESLIAFEAIHKPVVTIFGSGMTPEDHPYYPMTKALANALADAGYGVLTGGGKGLMQAANEGAIERKGASYSCRIALKNEINEKPYLYNVDRLVESFWLRKLFLIRPAKAFIVVPGGFGTLDEVFEVLTLMRTLKLDHRIVIFVGLEYWSFLRKFIEETLVAQGMIDESDLKLMAWVDSAEGVLDCLKGLEA